jgi:outer membrane murein-binding lipoprotein Lpp
MSQLADEERRIAEERRRDVAERERDATGRLGEQLMQAQAAVDQRLVDWQSDIEQLKQGLDEELKRIELRQRQLMAEVESKIGQDAEALSADIEEQRNVIARMRADLKRAADEVAQQANTELDQHAAERRHALHDVADRLRRRERDLQELVEREGNEAVQRIQLALGDIERRHVEQLQRTVSRDTTRYAEAAALSFDTAIKAAREEAARRLSRELDLSVERFAREAEGVLTERLNVVTEAAASRVEERLSRLRSALERQRDEALVSLEDRAHQVESSLRERLREIATDAESERAVLDGRLHELGRRLDELAART